MSKLGTLTNMVRETLKNPKYSEEFVKNVADYLNEFPPLFAAMDSKGYPHEFNLHNFVGIMSISGVLSATENSQFTDSQKLYFIETIVKFILPILEGIIEEVHSNGNEEA